MFKIFSKSASSNSDQSFVDFNYLNKNEYYFDSSCQTLRPQQVIEAETEYYQKFNSCGHRVKYKWGEKTDQKIIECRQNLLKLVGKSSKDYTVAFCLNATAGINMIVHQLEPSLFEKTITSEIEHSSVFLPTLTWAQRNKKERLVLERKADGSLVYDISELNKAMVVVNSTNNFDATSMPNLKQLANDVRAQNGMLLIDACQTMGHNPEILKDIDFDAVFGSGHKMYGPSIGFIIIKKSVLRKIDAYFIGGSTIVDNFETQYKLIDDEDELYARLEPGLQNFAGIIGLNEAINWRNSWKSETGKNSLEYENELSQYLWEKLKEVNNLEIINEKASGVVSLYPKEGIDSNRLGFYLAERNIMCRTGYHCVYYYLLHKKKYPPLLRISIGLHNTQAEIDFVVESIKMVMKTI
jgi:cysteine desulfurase/selenocysteine lyase